ncbi:MAG: IscA/HesB family protein [Syntrophobacteraceae bacterium]|nr:IscA/HesB family protein [Syntrophobacteraceae bacterium]
MITISEKAQIVLKDYFKEKEITPIRVFLHAGGCSGPSLAMVLDEPKDSDDVYDVDGFTILVDKELHQQTRDITVDYVSGSMGSGFQLTSEVTVGGGGGCGGGCSSSCCG